MPPCGRRRLLVAHRVREDRVKVQFGTGDCTFPKLTSNWLALRDRIWGRVRKFQLDGRPASFGQTYTNSTGGP